jgi:hypothetical protein
MAMFPGGMATLKATSKAATAMKTAIYAKVATSRRPWKVGTTRAKTLKQVALFFLLFISLADYNERWLECRADRAQ